MVNVEERDIRFKSDVIFAIHDANSKELTKIVFGNIFE